MSVSSTKYLAALNATLYGRPAGQNIIGYAIEEIQRLRVQLDHERERTDKLRAILVECNCQLGNALEFIGGTLGYNNKHAESAFKLARAALADDGKEPTAAPPHTPESRSAR